MEGGYRVARWIGIKCFVPLLVDDRAKDNQPLDGLGAYRAPSQPRRDVMKHLIIPLLLIGGFIALTTTEASAVVCAAGVYRAGCVAARPVVVAPRAVVVSPRAVVVAPHPVVVAPVRRRVY
jgi:hypothetical protein